LNEIGATFVLVEGLFLDELDAGRESEARVMVGSAEGFGRPFSSFRSLD
jgi:hypothetical protein